MMAPKGKMRETGISLLVGIGAAAAFEALNSFVHLLQGILRYGALGIIFVVFSVVALFFSKHQTVRRTTIGSDNRSGRRMDVDVDHSTALSGDDIAIGSRNRSKGDMSILVGSKRSKD